jgi:pimeloyl-ACP methyl ester carboxylesterase
MRLCTAYPGVLWWAMSSLCPTFPLIDISMSLRRPIFASTSLTGSCRYGPSELFATGPLKDWEGYSTAHKIDAETLLINGRYDEVQDVAVLPWFKRIRKIKWVQLANSSHMGQFEERERYMQLVGEFLTAEESAVSPR